MTDNQLTDEFRLPPDPKKRRIDPFYVWIICVAGIALAVACLCDCATIPQPEWVPVIYAPVNGGCMFENTQNPADTLMGGDFKMNSMYLTPVDEIDRIQSILNRCEKWGN